MCGSLLSKFKKTSNKVNPVISTNSPEPKQVKQRTNLVDHTFSVEESMFRGEITLSGEEFTRVRVSNSSEDRYFEVKPCETTMEAADENQSRSLSLCLLAVDFQGKQTACQSAAGIEQKKNKSEIGSTAECDSTVGIIDCGVTDECESLVRSVKKPDSNSGFQDEGDSTAVIVEKKMEAGSGSAVKFVSSVSLGEKKIEPYSRSAIECHSAAGIEEKKIEPVSRSAIECNLTADIEEGKIGEDSSSVVKSVSPAGNEKKKIGPQDECDSPAGNEEKKIGPVFASAIECDSASGIEEGKVGADCVSAVKSVSESGLEEKKIEPDSLPPIECDSAADIEEKKTESYSKSAVPSVSAFGLEEKKLELDCASLIESNATVGLTEKKAESDCRTVPECKSNACLDAQKRESDSGSAVEPVSAAGFEEKKTEPDSSFVIDCDSVASLEKKGTASDFRPASECELDACLDEKNSKSYSKSGRKCQSAVGIAQQKTEPDSRSVVECHLAGGLEEKKTGPVCESVTVCESTGATGLVCGSVTAACESAAVLEETKIEVGCWLTAECKSATCLVEEKAGSLYKYVAEWKSAAGLEEKKTKPEFKYGAKCQSAVGLTQKKAELESASGFEQKRTESESKSEAEIVEKINPFLRSAAICESNADGQVIESAFKVITMQQPNDYDFPPADEHVRVEKDLLGKREETAQDDTHSSSRISGGCFHAAKRPVETYKIPTANQAAVVEVQRRTCCGSLVQQLTESELQSMSQQSSIMTEEYEKKLSADQGSPDWNSTASRQTLLVKTKTEHQVKTTTDREVPLSCSTSQCSVDPMVVSGSQEMLLALASKELEEKIMNITANPNVANHEVFAANRELLLALARKELEKKILQMTVAHGGTNVSSRKRKFDHAEQKSTRSTNREEVLTTAREDLTKNFREKMAAFRRGLSPQNAVRSIVLGKTKSSIAFEVLDATKRKETVVPFARLPFSLRRLDEPPPLTADVFNAKLLRAQENRQRELERVRLRARSLVRPPAKGNNNWQHDV